MGGLRQGQPGDVLLKDKSLAANDHVRRQGAIARAIVADPQARREQFRPTAGELGEAADLA